MAWEHLSITKPHLVYIILGGFTSLFMLCSSVIKERMYIGEATVATICGLIFGPHAADLIDPQTWGNVDIVTIEFSRIVLVVQCFAVGVELPKFYMERHWKSVIFLLVPVMTFGWLITSLFVWWMVPPLDWLDSLVIAACVTATDPVLASSVVGKGKFAKRVPKHLRDLLSAESGCNDGMAFPFIYLSLYLIQDNRDASEVTFHWVVYTILYECIFGAVFGFLVGYIARHGIKFAERHDIIDRESFLVFYFVLALFCAGSGSILGVDDLLVGFSAGVGFSNDGWFGHKTDESHVSNVIDLLLNLAYFVFLGTIIPWEMFNDASLGLSAWRLTIIAIFVILFRRIPIMMALKPLIPDIKTWREALFAGHFGPIGVGAIFVAIMARAELESDKPVPLAKLPPPDSPHYTLLTLVWPIVSFLVVASIIVHGSSVAVFTLGKRINTLTLTMSYTTAPDEGPGWMNRLPRISSQSRSQARTMSDTDVDELKMPEVPPGTLLPVGIPGQFLRRLKDEDTPRRQASRASSRPGRRRRKKWDDGVRPGGPISQSAIFPQRRSQGSSGVSPLQSEPSGIDELDEPSQSSGQATAINAEDGSRPESDERDDEKDEGEPMRPSASQRHSSDEAESSTSPRRVLPVNVYDEGNDLVIETQEGEVLSVEPLPPRDGPSMDEVKEHLSPTVLKEKLAVEASKAEAGTSSWMYGALKKRIGNWRDEEIKKRKEKEKDNRKHEPARAYQFGNTIIVEDEDGEVLKKYDLPPQKAEKEGGTSDVVAQSLKYMGMGSLIKPSEKAKDDEEQDPKDGPEDTEAQMARGSSKAPMSNWMGFNKGVGGEPSTQRQRKKSVAEEKQEEDDRHIRFTIGGVGQHLTKESFIREMQKLDQSTRREVVDLSSASHTVKTLAKQDAPIPEIVVSDPADRGKRRAEAFPTSMAGDKSSSRSRAPRRNNDGSGDGGDGDDSSASLEMMTQTRRGRHASIAAATSAAATAAATAHRTKGVSGQSTANDDGGDEDEDEMAETAVERRRRLAALEGVDDSEEEEGSHQGDGPDDSGSSNSEGEDDEDTRETPAERRRREAALGMSSAPSGDSDSDDDDTPRVPPVRRGIRFADTPQRQ